MTTSGIVKNLIKQYYSIQDYRVMAFNRIVNFVKLHREEILNKLKSHPNYVNHIGIASHSISENQYNGASHLRNEHHLKVVSHHSYENHHVIASHIECEDHMKNASQTSFANQNRDASHYKIETQEIDANRDFNVTQIENVSQPKIETQLVYAIQLLEKRKYADFVKKFLISQKRIESHLTNAILSILEEIDENLILQIRLHNELYRIEKWLYKELDKWSKEHPLRKEYLNKVRGIGAVLASGIIAFLSEPIKKAQYISQIWSYCGLAPQQVGMQRRGVKLNYDPFLKSFVVFRLGRSLLMFNKFAKKLYNAFKEDAKRKHPDWTKLHLHNHARRKVVKLFLASVWEIWRKMNGLPTTEPYPIEILGHKDKIKPEDWVIDKK